MGTKTLDLRGLSCPQPVLETKQAIEDPLFDELAILVDTKTSVENIQRLVSDRKDIRYTIEEQDDFTINLMKIKG